MSISTNNGKAIKTVDDAFKWFERNVARVPDDENADGKSVHPEIRKSVSDALDLEHHFLSGSYGRKTQAKHLKDVDMLVVLEDEDGALYSSASDALEQVSDAVGDCNLVRRTRVSVRTVKCFLVDYEFHVDVVPALKRGSGEGLYLTRNIPDENLDDWSLEYPEQQLKACQDKNKATGGLYIPATRVVKAWNQRYDTTRPLRSYHAEALLYHGIGDAQTLKEAVLAFFDHAHDALAPGKLTATPGAPSGRYVDDRLDADDRKAAREKVEAAREKAHEAADVEDPGKAMEAWVKVFGSGFPSPTTEPGAVDAALRAGTAFAAGTGVSVGKSQESREYISGRSWSRS
jgi:hypothetical protein